MPQERVGQRALAGAVRAHQRMHLARVDCQIDAVQDLLTIDGDPQVVDQERWSLIDVTHDDTAHPTCLVLSRNISSGIAAPSPGPTQPPARSASVVEFRTCETLS